MAKEQYTVTFNKDEKKWQIKKTDAARVIANFDTKDEALKRVKQLSKNQDIPVQVKKKDGKFGKTKV